MRLRAARLWAGVGDDWSGLGCSALPRAIIFRAFSPSLREQSGSEIHVAALRVEKISDGFELVAGDYRPVVGQDGVPDPFVVQDEDVSIVCRGHKPTGESENGTKRGWKCQCPA